MINVGAGNIQAIKVGAEDAIKAYQGSTLVWTAGGPVYTALTCEYLVVETGETKIANAMVNPTYFTGMTVDGVEAPIANTYVFDTPGLHVVEWQAQDPTNISIPDDAFREVYGLKVVHLPSVTTYIGMSAFYGCTGLTECNMSGTAIWSINSGAFQGCTSLRSIDLPPCTRIQAYSFYNCTSVSSITLTDTITRIDDYAFSFVGSSSSQAFELEIPSSVTQIDRSAFDSCHFNGLILNEGLEVIGDDAFNDTDGYSLEIPSTVTSIGSGAFGNQNIDSVRFKSVTPPTLGGDIFFGAGNVNRIEVPAGSLAAYQAVFPGYNIVEY